MIYRIKCIVVNESVNMSADTENGESVERSNRGGWCCREAWCYGNNPHRSSDLNEIYRILSQWKPAYEGVWYIVEQYQ